MGNPPLGLGICVAGSVGSWQEVLLMACVRTLASPSRHGDRDAVASMNRLMSAA